MERRDFLAAATALGAIACAPPAAAFAPVPLRAEPRRRLIFPRLDRNGAWLLHSDGPEAPPATVRRAVIERVFGAGTFDTLHLPDHWAMIEAGWFGGEDLHQPIPVADEVHDLWRAFHHPVCEAHDLIADLFGARTPGHLGCPEMIARGLEMAEHPCTPRFATARIRSDERLCDLAAEVARRTDRLAIVLPEEVRWRVDVRGAAPDPAAEKFNRTFRPTPFKGARKV